MVLIIVGSVPNGASTMLSYSTICEIAVALPVGRAELVIYPKICLQIWGQELPCTGLVIIK